MNNFFSKVLMWLFIGMFVTFGTGYMISNSYALMNFFLGSSLSWILLIVEFILVIVLSVRVYKMKKSTAIVIYILYAILNGITLSSIFIVFKMSSLIFIFLVTAIMFLLFAVVGNFIKIDLGKLTIYLFMALVANLILFIVNIFLMNNTLNMLACSMGIIIFCIYTAYDINRIKQMESYNDSDNMAIYMAFQLYLDFINIFIELLKLFGKSRD